MPWLPNTFTAESLMIAIRQYLVAGRVPGRPRSRRSVRSGRREGLRVILLRVLRSGGICWDGRIRRGSRCSSSLRGLASHRWRLLGFGKLSAESRPAVPGHGPERLKG